MQSSVFLVNDDPFCVWEPDLKECCQRFLKGLDPDYFEYSYNSHLETDDEKRASVALRLNLHHSIETLFSLLGALVQAPDVPFAWLSKCSTPTLRTVVERISNGDKRLNTKLNVSVASWPEIARLVHATYLPGTERQKETAEGFANLWQRMAYEFLSADYIDEYNSIKHGFRVRSGGFGLAVAIEETPGVAPPPEAFEGLAKSDFGSSFFKLEALTAIHGDRSLVLVEKSVNWSLERTVLLNQAAFMSINNVVSALRVINGVDASECKFLRPEDSKNFLAPWNYSTGVGAMTWRRGTEPQLARSTTRQELMNVSASWSAPA